MNLVAPSKLTNEDTSFYSLAALCLFLAMFFMPLKRGASLGWIGMPWEITFFKILLVFAFVVWITRSVFNKTNSLFSSPFITILNIAAILHVLVSIFSILNSVDPAAALPHLFRRVSMVVFFFLIINVVKDKKALRLIIITFLAGVAIECVAGVYELVTKQPVLNAPEVFQETVRESEELHQEGGKVRIQGFVLDPDLHAYIILIGTGIVLGAIFSNFIVRSKWSRFLLIIILALMITNIFAASSRASWIALLISFITFFLFATIKYKGIMITGMLFLLGIVFIGLISLSDTLIIERLTNKTGNWSIFMRMNEFKLGMAMFRSHPILGVGTGNSLIVRHRYAKNVPRLALDVNTNGYMILLSENGLLGFAAYTFVLYAFLSNLIRANRTSRNRDDKNMMIGFLSAGLPHIFLLFFYPVADAEGFWFLLGVGFILSQIHMKRVKAEIPFSPQAGAIQYPKRKEAI